MSELMNIPQALPTGSFLDSPAVYEHLKRASSVFAQSDLVPVHYKGKPEEIFIALDSARALQVNPMMYLQNTHIIHGKLGMSSTLVHSLVESRGGYKIRYEVVETEEVIQGLGKNIRVRCWAKDSDGERVDGPWVDLKMAQAEGWATKSGSKYKTMPELMLRYRASTFFARTICPEVLNGMHTVEEIQEMDVTPRQPEYTVSDSVLDEVEIPVEVSEPEPEHEPEPEPAQRSKKKTKSKPEPEPDTKPDSEELFGDIDDNFFEEN